MDKANWKQAQDIVTDAINRYQGDGKVLESAIGALFVGYFMGWRVLRVIHGSSTYAKYEEILGIEFKKICPTRTALSRRSRGYEFAENSGNFWKLLKERSIPSELRGEIAR